MRVTETEKTYQSSRLTNYKQLREKYMYHYVAVINTNNASNENGSGPSINRYEHNNIKKSDKTQQVGSANFRAQQMADKENKTMHEKLETISSVQITTKNTKICPRCLVNPKMMCDHCKKKLAHDKRASILQSEPLKILRKTDSRTCCASVPNSRELLQLYRIPSEKTTTTTSTRLSIISDPKNYQKLLETELRKTSTIQTTSDDSYYFFKEWDKYHKKPKWIQAKEKLMPPMPIKQEHKLQLEPSENENMIAEEKKKPAVKKSGEKIPKKELEKLLKSQADIIKKEKLSRINQRKAIQGDRAMQAIIKEVEENSDLLRTKESNTEESSNTSTILSCGVLESKMDKMIIGERIVKRHAKKTTTLPIPSIPVVNKRKIIKEKHKPKTEYQICDKASCNLYNLCRVSEKVLTTKKVRSQPLRTECGILYALSDTRYIDNGWTILPCNKMLRKMNVYRMYPSQPEFDWFEQNKWRGYMTYDTGDKFAEFEEDGRCRIYYKNGRLALDYYAAEESNAKRRFVVYSNGEPSKYGRAHPVTVLAIFDYLGNGIVLDHGGNPRLKYNQTEGVVLDRSVGPVATWQWHSLNDPPDLRCIMIDNHLPHKDPVILELGQSHEDSPRQKDEDMEAIELENYAKEKAKKLAQYHNPFEIKMKALKINENFSLKILDQATIYLIFRDGSVNIKFHIGMVLDNRQIIDTDIAELGVVSNNVERLTAVTDSVVALRSTIKRAQQYDMKRTERERLLRPPAHAKSADRIVAGLSRPLRQVPLKQQSVSNSNVKCSTCVCKSFVSQ